MSMKADKYGIPGSLGVGAADKVVKGDVEIGCKFNQGLDFYVTAFYPFRYGAVRNVRVFRYAVIGRFPCGA